MIQESLEGQHKLQSLIRAAENNPNENQLFELYLQLHHYISEECRKEESADVVYNILSRINNPKLFRAVLFNFAQKSPGRAGNEIQNAILKLIKERFHQPFTIQLERRQNNAVIADFLAQSKGPLLENLVEQCKNSQLVSHNLLYSWNELLMKKIRSDCAINLNLTITCLLAFKIVQNWQNASLILLEQALRHILLVDFIQKGQALGIICQNTSLLSALRVLAGKEASLNGYWFLLVAKLIELLPKQTPSNQALLEQLEQKALEIVSRTVQKDKDLSCQIYNIEHSSLSSSQKLRMIQMVRGYCVFISAYTNKQIKLGVLDQSLIQSIQQLMGIKDFFSFEYLIIIYAEICQLNQERLQKLPHYMIERIERNCLPLFKTTDLIISKLQKSNQLIFLDSTVEHLYRYSSSLASSEAMQSLIDKILDERGCKRKPKICPCFDSYIHSTIEMQYDQQFNEHDFISVTNLMCREAVRVIGMRPEEDQLQALKSYLLQNIKWLLNLNQSCLAEYKRCINFKIFDLIVTFPYILNNNQFLQQVTEDLLVDRIPQTFYHIHKLIQFYAKTDPQTKTDTLDRIGDKLLAKASHQALRFIDKINIWNFAIIIWQHNQPKLKEILELYSLHDDQWVAKHCASQHRRLKIMDPYSQKLAEIQEKWHKNSSFYYEQLNILRRWHKQN